ncbi:MAG: acyl-CoA thioesterase [Congregibacter sp.]
MKFTEILAAARHNGDKLIYPGPEEWKQGRTLFGGLTASLCLHSALEKTGETRPLRSAMISFVGPSSDHLTGFARVLRSGRTASTIHAGLQNNGNEATAALLTFSPPRESAVLFEPASMPAIGGPDIADIMDLSSIGGPIFMRNFDVIAAGGSIPMSGSTKPEVSWWARHKDPDARGSQLGLVCLGDILPPAALTMASTPTPISSMTWMIDLVRDDLATDDGWYLFHSRADVVAGGFSTQDMSIWNTAGNLIAKGRQTVTMFG